MRFLVLCLTLAIGSITALAAGVEKPAALNGSQYAVIAPVYDGSNGAQSYIRLFNGEGANSTFNITIVNANNGITLGAAAVQVPANASPQYPLTPGGGSNSIFAQAGVADTSGTSYALYVQNAYSLTGYQHVTFNSSTALFENNSLCTSLLNQAMTLSNTVVLTNVHTSALAAYPSTVSLHNYSASSITVTLSVADAATGSSLGTFNETIAANDTLPLPESQIESQLGFRPTSAQPHINILITNAAGGTVPVEVGQSIHNAQLGGDINMTEACTVNNVGTNPSTTSSLPVAYCGTSTEPTPYGTVTTTFVASVAPDGRVRAYSFGEEYGFYFIGSSVGQLNGTTVELTSLISGQTVTGTIQNGIISGSAPGPYGGTATAYGTTTACN